MLNTTQEDVVSLHKYFIWSDRMKVHFDGVLKKIEGSNLRKKQSVEANLYMSYWYGGMYVVIEGWNDLGLKDDAIDKLLKSKNVKLLRGYRNGVFHYQRKYFDKRFIDLMTKGEKLLIGFEI